MIKQALTGAIAASLLLASATFANEDSSNAATPAPAVSLNPMNPATFMNLMNPATHRPYHQAIVDPAQWAQFMQPSFYMQMADPQLMMQWMNPATYQAAMNPQTFMHWMQPNVIMGEITSFQPQVYMNPASYQQLMNPAAFMGWFEPTTYSGIGEKVSEATSGLNWFDMGNWSNMMQPAPEAKSEQEEG